MQSKIFGDQAVSGGLRLLIKVAITILIIINWRSCSAQTGLSYANFSQGGQTLGVVYCSSSQGFEDLAIGVSYSGKYIDNSFSCDDTWINPDGLTSTNVTVDEGNHYLVITFTRPCGKPVSGSGQICSFLLGGGIIIDNIDHL